MRVVTIRPGLDSDFELPEDQRWVHVLSGARTGVRLYWRDPAYDASHRFFLEGDTVGAAIPWPGQRLWVRFASDYAGTEPLRLLFARALGSPVERRTNPARVLDAGADVTVAQNGALNIGPYDAELVDVGDSFGNELPILSAWLSSSRHNLEDTLAFQYVSPVNPAGWRFGEVAAPQSNGPPPTTRGTFKLVLRRPPVDQWRLRYKRLGATGGDASVDYLLLLHA